MFFSTMDLYLDSNCLLCEKIWTLTSSTSWSYGRLASKLPDEIRLDFKILMILYRLNYLDFYFVYSSAMLLVMLEVLRFSSKVYFKVYFVECKVW